RRRHTRSKRDWSSDVCSSDLSVSKFCSDFNERSDFLSGEIPLLVDIFLLDNREFKFIIRGVNLVKLLRRFVAGRFKVTRKEVFQIGRASCRERGEMLVRECSR